MKALIVCDSQRVREPRRVAETMAGALGAEVVTPHEARRIELADYVVVGFGSGIYAMNLYSDLRQFVEALPKVESKRAFFFLTSASSTPRTASRCCARSPGGRRQSTRLIRLAAPSDQRRDDRPVTEYIPGERLPERRRALQH
jgi:Flavodoxin domain